MSLPIAYFTREALRQAWRQRLLSLVAVSALGLAALSAGAWALLLRNASHWHQALGQAAGAGGLSEARHCRRLCKTAR